MLDKEARSWVYKKKSNQSPQPLSPALPEVFEVMYTIICTSVSAFGCPPYLHTKAAQLQPALQTAAVRWKLSIILSTTSSQSWCCSNMAPRFSVWSTESVHTHFCLGFALITIHLFWSGSVTQEKKAGKIIPSELWCVRRCFCCRHNLLPFCMVRSVKVLVPPVKVGCPHTLLPARHISTYTLPIINLVKTRQNNTTTKKSWPF